MCAVEMEVEGTWQGTCGWRVERMETSYFVQELRVNAKEEEWEKRASRGGKERPASKAFERTAEGLKGLKGPKGRREGFAQRRLEGRELQERGRFKGEED